MMFSVLERTLQDISTRRVLLARQLPIPLGLALLAMGLDWLRAVGDDFSGIVALALGFTVFSLYLAATVLVAVVVHRVMLLGKVADQGLWVSWTLRETWFALHMIALMLIAVLLFVLAAVPLIGWLLALLAIGYVFGRLSLVFPGIAVDRGVSFGNSRRLTSGHGMSMFMLVAFIPCVLLMPVAWMPDAWWGVPVRLAWSFAVEILAIACLSLAYHEITTKHWEQADRPDDGLDRTPDR